MGGGGGVLVGTSLSGHGAGTALVSLVAEGGLQVTLLLSLRSHKALPRTVIVRPPLRAAQSGPAGRLCGSDTWLGKLVLASLQAPQIWGAPLHLALGMGRILLPPLRRWGTACLLVSRLCGEGSGPRESDWLAALN